MLAWEVHVKYKEAWWLRYRRLWWLMEDLRYLFYILAVLTVFYVFKTHDFTVNVYVDPVRIEQPAQEDTKEKGVLGI